MDRNDLDRRRERSSNSPVGTAVGWARNRAKPDAGSFTELLTVGPNGWKGVPTAGILGVLRK